MRFFKQRLGAVGNATLSVEQQQTALDGVAKVVMEAVTDELYRFRSCRDKANTKGLQPNHKTKHTPGTSRAKGRAHACHRTGKDTSTPYSPYYVSSAHSCGLLYTLSRACYTATSCTICLQPVLSLSPSFACLPPSPSPQGPVDVARAQTSRAYLHSGDTNTPGS